MRSDKRTARSFVPEPAASPHTAASVLSEAGIWAIECDTTKARATTTVESTLKAEDEEERAIITRAAGEEQEKEQANANAREERADANRCNRNPQRRIPVFWGTNVSVFRCFGVSVFRCFGVSVFRCFGFSRHSLVFLLRPTTSTTPSLDRYRCVVSSLARLWLLEYTA